jgi:hypothetical protein
MTVNGSCPGADGTGLRARPSSPCKGMSKTRKIYEPTRSGAPFVAAIFNPQGRIVASHAFPTRAGAERFLQAFMQEGAGEHGPTMDDAGRLA